MAKKQIFVGVDMDSVSIRSVRLAFDPDKGAQSGWKLLSTAEIDGGNLLDDANAVAALKNLREKLGARQADKVSICLSGKQTYVTQMDARKLPDEDMADMLRLELRKSMPFQPSAATIDYQVFPTEQSGGINTDAAGVSVMVSAATDSYLERQVNIFGKAGLPPCNVGVLPISVANAFWAACGDGSAEPDGAVLILHFGTDVCTVVIDGRNTPFFSRAFAFNIALAVGEDDTQESDGKTPSTIDILAGEVTKSANYYKNTYRVNGVSSIFMLGKCASHMALDGLVKKTGYPTRVIQTASFVQAAKPLEQGKYDLAIALAMQAA